jgi:hypothetical protein
MPQIKFRYATDSESLPEILDKTTECLESERQLLQNAAKELQCCNPVSLHIILNNSIDKKYKTRCAVLLSSSGLANATQPSVMVPDVH